MAALVVTSLAVKQVTDQKVLEEAISTLQKYRSVLGDAVVETAVFALQDQLSHSLKNREITQYEAVTVLEADLSGFTAMSAMMDAERVRDAMNALWERLDNVVVTWGGRIEQHIGDSLIALFGIPHFHEDDPQRAVLAALDMQMELALFNEAAATASDTNPLSTLAQELQMRVGIHLGPLLLGRMGQSVGVTAVGDTMRIVGEVEKKAPVGGILLSYPVYRKVFGLFEVKKMPPLAISGLDDEIPVYRVLGEKSRAFYAYNASFSLGMQSSFVGRSEELARLELAFQETLDYSVMQVVTVTGEVGSGKSRLFAEFERWLTMLPVRGCVLRGASTSLMGSVPYGLLRTMLFDYFEIHQRSTMTVMREKFVRGVAHVSYSANVTARQQGQTMGRLLGLDFTGGEDPEEQADEQDRLAQQGIRDFVHLFTDLASRCLPLVLVLEDAQEADAASLHVIDRLLAKSPDLPILVVCLARPSLLEKRPSWSSLDPLSPYTTINLPPLSAIDCRHMVAEMLSEVRHVPLRLSDLIVDAAGGNPLFVGQLIHLLYDEAVIQRQGERPVVHLGRLDKLMMPRTLPDLYRRRFACLDEREQAVLAAAAVVGRTFWDVAVLGLLETAVPLSRADLKVVLASLEQKELVIRQRFSTLVGPVEYKFVQEALRDEVYAQIPTAVCIQHHQQVAAWLQNRPQDRHLPFYKQMIASHYREAGDETAAARWEER